MRPTLSSATTAATTLLTLCLTSTTATGSQLRSSSSHHAMQKRQEGEKQDHRHLSFAKMVGYEPETDVRDHASLDLDQQIFEEQLSDTSDAGFTRARTIYMDGIYSKSFAHLGLITPLAQDLFKGDLVEGKSSSGKAVLGAILNDLPTGATFMEVQYETNSRDDGGCYVGALGDNQDLYDARALTAGCFADTGTVFVTNLKFEQQNAGTSAASFDYSYSTQFNNNNARTLSGFSTQAQAKMLDCQETGGCPYVDYKKFFDYYGRKGDYAHQWVMAALTSNKVTLGSFQADFSPLGFEARAEAAKKGSAYMGVWMYVIREFEDALDDCVEGRITDNEDPVHAWDEGVAFYAGSLEGSVGNEDGVFPYRLAEKRCQNFKTCGPKGDELAGKSYINIELLRLFDQGQNDILTGQCAEARKKKEHIVQLMTVPLIQGTLRYAYRSAELPNIDTQKAQAEGSTFAAAVLPIIADCNGVDADIIYEQMKVGAGGAKEYDLVKSAFERNYKCIGITCALVGGLWDDGEQRYFDGAHPCKEEGEKNKLAIGLGIGLGIPLLITLLCLFTACQRNRKEALPASATMGPSLNDTTAEFAPGEEGNKEYQNFSPVT